MWGTSWDEILGPQPVSPYAGMRALPPMTPQEEQTILGSLLQKTTGALETIGNTLDLPGSMVRDVLTGNNPLDQLFSPFSSDNRVSGRQLLEQYGLAPQNDPNAWEMNDFIAGPAGVAAEIGLDPLTYLTFGGSAAKTLAGKAAQKAGMLDDVAKVASAKAGRAIGQREALMTTSVDDLLGALPETARAAKTDALANAGYDAATMGNQPLGSPLGWQIPFTNIGGAIGAGKSLKPQATTALDEWGYLPGVGDLWLELEKDRARVNMGLPARHPIMATNPDDLFKAAEDYIAASHKIATPQADDLPSSTMQLYARGLDRAGEAINATYPMRKLRSLFDPTAGGSDYVPAQKAAAEVGRQREAIDFKVSDDAYQALQKLGPERANNDSLAFYLENPSLIEMEGDAAFTARGLPPISPEAKMLLDEQVIKPQKEIFDRRAALGMPYEEFGSDMGVEYAPRYGTEPNKPSPGFGPSQWKEYAKKTSSDKARDPVLDIPGGRVAVNDFVDPQLVGEGDDVLEGADRVDHVLSKMISRWLPDLRDAYSADGKDPATAFISEVRAAVQKRNRAAGEYVSDQHAADAIKAVAAKRGIDPYALENAVVDDLARRNEEFKALHDPWKTFWDHQLPTQKDKMNFWKAVRNAESKGSDVETLQLGGWKMDELADMALRSGLIPGHDNPRQELWDMMLQHGSPTNLKGMLSPRIRVPNSQQFIENRLLDDNVRKAIIDDTLAPKSPVDLTEDELAMAKYFDKAKGISEYMRGVDPKKMEAGVGVFGNHVLQDAEKYIREGRTSIANLEGIHNLFRESLTNGGGPEFVPIRDAFAYALGKDGDPDTALKTFMESLPADKQAMGFVPQQAVQWAQKTVEMTQSPEAVNWLTGLVDNITQGWKLGVTLAPAFHVRNMTGGMIQNFLSGFVGMQDALPKAAAARRALAGDAIPGLSKAVPMFKGMSDKEATNRFMELAQSLGIFQSQLSDGVTGAKTVVPKPGEFKPGVSVRLLDRQNRGKILEDLGNDQFRVQFTSPQTGKASESVLPRHALVWDAAGKGPVDFGGATPVDRMVNRIPGRGAPLTAAGTLKETAQDIASGVKKLKDVRKDGFPAELNPAAMAGVGGRAADEFALAKLQRNMSQWVEGQVRLSALQGLLEKGYDPLQAKKMIDAAQVDYGNLTQFEKQYMRRAIPFYSYNRRMAEFVADQLMTNPGGPYAMAIRAANAPRNSDVFTPDYISEGTAIPLGPGRFITGLGLMHEGPLDMMAMGPTPLKTVQRTLQKVGAAASPMVRLPVELATGRSLYTGRPLRENHQFPFEGGEAAVAANMLLGNSPLSRALSTVRKIGDDRKGPLTKAVNVLTGVQIADMKGGPERAQEFAARKVNEEYLRDNPKFSVFETIHPKKDKMNTLTPLEMDAWRYNKLQTAKARKAAKENAARGG